MSFSCGSYLQYSFEELLNLVQASEEELYEVLDTLQACPIGGVSCMCVCAFTYIPSPPLPSPLLPFPFPPSSPPLPLLPSPLLPTPIPLIPSPPPSPLLPSRPLALSRPGLQRQAIPTCPDATGREGLVVPPCPNEGHVSTAQRTGTKVGTCTYMHTYVRAHWNGLRVQYDSLTPVSTWARARARAPCFCSTSQLSTLGQEKVVFE